MRRAVVLLAAVPCALLLGACSSGHATPHRSSAPKHSATPGGPTGPVDTSAVVSFLDLAKDPANPDVYLFTTPAGQKCEVDTQILIGTSMVSLYAGAGDTVATTPNKAVGVKIVDPETKTCADALTAALYTFEG